MGACGPKNTFTWQGRELGLSGSNPGCPPKWQRWGTPLTRARVRVLLPHPASQRGWHGLAPPIYSASTGWQPESWGSSSNLCNCPPKQRSQGATLAPPRTPQPALAKGAAHSGSSGRGSDRPPVQTAGPQPPVTPWPTFRGVSVALGARQDKSTGPVSPLPQNNSVFFLSAS